MAGGCRPTTVCRLCVRWGGSEGPAAQEDSVPTRISRRLPVDAGVVHSWWELSMLMNPHPQVLVPHGTTADGLQWQLRCSSCGAETVDRAGFRRRSQGRDGVPRPRRLRQPDRYTGRIRPDRSSMPGRASFRADRGQPQGGRVRGCGSLQRQLIRDRLLSVRAGTSPR
ncbi:hypothetical protein Franean1_2790 [Parafrankia sp. EAN1pec]|nr:hypothetical protein Franean1_2790 [Frankia sp. EAN1pec]